MASIVDAVRTTCARVAQNADLVQIDADAVARLAQAFDVAGAKRRADGDVVGDPNNPERAIALALASVAINFTSGWHDIIRKRPGMSGATSMVARLVDYEQITGAFTPARLQQITAVDCSQIFEQELDGGAVQHLLDLLSDTLNDLGALGEASGSFSAFVDGADASAVALTTALAERAPWHDVATHHGQPVAFHKRAQLAAATLHRTFGGSTFGRFDDLDELTIFADNLVPHVLRLDGVLSYDAELLATIDRGELLEHGSPGEVEIRACGVHAAELLAAGLRRLGHEITCADIDHALWSRGGGPTYKAARRHRCRNRFY